MIVSSFSLMFFFFLLISCSTTIVSAFVSSSSRQHASPNTLLYSTSVVVVSPPGGVGQVTVVKAAERGCKVRWLVIENQADDANDESVVVLTQNALDRISEAGGAVELAGATVQSIMEGSGDSEKDMLAEVQKWNDATVLVSTMDGVESSSLSSSSRKRNKDGEQTELWKSAIKVATQKTAEAISPQKSIAILSAAEDVTEEQDGDDDEGTSVGELVGGFLFGNNNVRIPSSLIQAMGKESFKLRHGNLFGMPDSSPDFSPLLGGPKRQAELCEEYRMRAVRVDPTLSVSGNIMMGDTTQSSRHAVGEAAALMGLDQVTCSPDVCVSSQPGRDPVTLSEWQGEFERVKKAMESGQAAKLFSCEFASVPDTERLADWLATKWAPTVLRTYDIAAIRTGARPVFVDRGGQPGEVVITWQQLVDFQTETVGRMMIRVTDTELIALRGPGDGRFASVSTKPLAGEAVLVRRLAEAAAQAMEKGLAVKPQAIMKKKKPTRPAVKVESKPPPPSPPVAVANESGPRKAGARRSVERKRRKTPKSPTQES